MQRPALLCLAATLTFSSAGALAQSGALSGVTMRVLDDLSGVDAVVLATRRESGRGRAGRRCGRRQCAAACQRKRAARRHASVRAATEPESERRAAKRERDELHDTDIDERSEGHLEDRDVERPAVAAPASP